MDWEEVQQEFVFDGSVCRDIYILDADIETWQRVLDFLRLLPVPPRYEEDGEKTGLPDSVATIFARREECSPTLWIDVDSIQIHGHFFDDEEIELSFDPRNIDSRARLESLCDFVRKLGQHLKRDVIVTHDNDPEKPFLTYGPAADTFRYTPVGPVY